MGGPGPTKYDFEKGGYLNYQLKDRVFDVVDTAYVEEQGVKEVMEKAPEIMKKVRYIEEKEIMQKFLYEVGHDTGLVTYGEGEVRRLFTIWRSPSACCFSESVDLVRLTVKCSACGNEEQYTIKAPEEAAFRAGTGRQAMCKMQCAIIHSCRQKRCC